METETPDHPSDHPSTSVICRWCHAMRQAHAARSEGATRVAGRSNVGGAAPKVHCGRVGSVQVDQHGRNVLSEAHAGGRAQHAEARASASASSTASVSVPLAPCTTCLRCRPQGLSASRCWPASSPGSSTSSSTTASGAAWPTPARAAVGESHVIPLHPPLPLVRVSIAMERERQQNGSLADGLGMSYVGTAGEGTADSPIWLGAGPHNMDCPPKRWP